MLQGFYVAWKQLKPTHQLLAAFAIISFGIGAIIIERALNDILLDFLNSYVVLGLGLLVTAIAMFFLILKPHPIIISVFMVGIILIIFGAYTGG